MKKIIIISIVLLMFIGTGFSQSYTIINIPTREFKVINVDKINSNQLKITFNRNLDQESAENISNYKLSKMPVFNVILSGNNKVILNTTYIHERFSYILFLNNVKDNNGNIIENNKFYFSFGNESLLWKNNGNIMNQERLLDFSYAGYHYGEHNIPNIPIVANVIDFGAVPNDGLSDVNAFLEAINSTDNGAILIPNGEYIIDDILLINKSNIVLRGENNTILNFTKNLFDIYPYGKNFEYTIGGLIWIGEEYIQNTTSYRNLTRNSIYLSKILENSEFNSNSFIVSNPNNFSIGDTVILEMKDDINRSMYWHLLGETGVVAQNIIKGPTPLHHFIEITDINDNIIEFKPPLPFDVRTEWNPNLYEYYPVEEVGIENLILKFPDVMAQRHFGVGYNGIFFFWAKDCWAKNIFFENCDNMISFAQSSRCSAQDIKAIERSLLYQNITQVPIDDIYGTPHDDGHEVPGGQGGIDGSGGSDDHDDDTEYEIRYINISHTGHHGISFTSSSNYNTVSDFNFDNCTFWHEITVTHLAHLNVIRNGKGKDICFDHHGDCPFGNLFTDIFAGEGTRIWASGGNFDVGTKTGSYETFWNIRSINWTKLSYPKFPQYIIDDDFTGELVPDNHRCWTNIGMNNNLKINIIPSYQTNITENLWNENIENISPSDLYLSQLQKRLNKISTDEKYYRHGDLNNNGIIDDDDYNIFRKILGLNTTNIYNKEIDFDGDGIITFIDYQWWLDLYRTENNI